MVGGSVSLYPCTVTALFALMKSKNSHFVFDLIEIAEINGQTYPIVTVRSAYVTNCLNSMRSGCVKTNMDRNESCTPEKGSHRVTGPEHNWAKDRTKKTHTHTTYKYL